MNDALYVAASGMETVQRMLDTASHNAVNNQSPGYQRHEIVARAFGSFLKDATDRENLIGGREVVIFDQGELRPDPRPYSLALEGDGFFAVKGDDGNTYYTRNGQFTLDEAARLSTAAGYVLQGEGGEIAVDPSGGDVTIDEEGAVLQAGGEIGRIRVVGFSKEDLHRLEKAGETIFAAPADAVPGPAQGTRVHQHSLELPGFGMQATIKMLLASKNFDAMQRTIRTIDQVQQQLIRAVQ